MAGLERAEPHGLAGDVQAFDQPFRHWLIRDVLPGDLSVNCWNAVPPVTWDGWHTAGMGACYNNELERGKRTSRDLALLPTPIISALRYLNATPYAEALCERLGVEYFHPDPTLHGGGLHILEAAGWLVTHLDYALHPTLPTRERRLNVITFLNPVWDASWGGAFELCDPMGVVVKRVYPEFNTAVAFETSDLSYHGVQKMSRNAPERATLALYYLSAVRPGVTRKRALFVPRRETV